MTDPIKLCMIGAGRHGSYNIYPCFRLLRDAQVLANADLDLDQAQAVAKNFGIDRRGLRHLPRISHST